VPGRQCHRICRLSIDPESIILTAHPSSPYFILLGGICGTVSQVSTFSSFCLIEHFPNAHGVFQRARHSSETWSDLSGHLIIGCVVHVWRTLIIVDEWLPRIAMLDWTLRVTPLEVTSLKAKVLWCLSMRKRMAVAPWPS
jgi:hypothetical protein